MNDSWETPQRLFDQLEDEFAFAVDLAANRENWKCPVYLGEGGIEPDSLTADWRPYLKLGAGWLNPPYSRGQQEKFLLKTIHELRRLGRGTVVALLPADTSTRLFHELVQPIARDVMFLKGRLRFELGGIPEGTARFASLIAVYKGEDLREREPFTLNSLQPEWEPSPESGHSPDSTPTSPDNPQ